MTDEITFEKKDYKPTFKTLDKWRKGKFKDDDRFKEYRNAFTGKQTEGWTFYRTYGEHTIIINTSRIAFTKSDVKLIQNLQLNYKKLFSVENKFYMLDGRHIGEEVAKHYWNFFVSEKDDKTNYYHIRREAPTQLKSKTKEKEVIFSGRIDILDNANKLIIELKSHARKMNDFPHKSSMKQAVIYKMGLIEEDAKKYEEYDLVVVGFMNKWQQENLQDAFWVIEISDEQYKEIEKEVNRQLKICMLWFEEAVIDKTTGKLEVECLKSADDKEQTELIKLWLRSRLEE